MKINELLDATKNAKGIKSDGELARMLGVSKQAVSRYYLGERAPDEFACLKIADATGMPLDTVIATVKAASEKDETRREAWENYMKRLGGVAAGFAVVVICIVTLAVTSAPLEASAALAFGPSGFVLCKIVCQLQIKAILRRIRQKFDFRVDVAWVGQMAT